MIMFNLERDYYELVFSIDRQLKGLGIEGFILQVKDFYVRKEAKTKQNEWSID